MNLEEIQDKIDQYLGVLRKYRVWFIIIVLMFGIGFGIFASTSPTYYVAHASFHPETNSNSSSMIPSSPLSFLLGSGGLDGNDADRMEEVLMSRKLSEAVVRDSVFIDSTQFLLADLVLEKYPKKFSLIKFFKNLFNPPAEDKLDTKVIRAGKYIKTGLKIEKVPSGFLNMDFSFNDYKLSEILSNKYIEKLTEYYTNQKTEKAKINLDFFTERAAFVKRQIDTTATQFALFQERNNRLRFASRMVSAKELETKLEYLKEMYKTLVTNREQAASQLQRDTPIIQVLDEPRPPFFISQKSVLIYSLFGLFLGAFIAVVWLTRKLWWGDIVGYIKMSIENTSEE